MPFRFPSLPPKDVLAAKLIDYPLLNSILRILLYERLFRAVLIGLFLMIIPILALAGSLAAKKLVPASAGTFQVEGPTFIVLLIGTVLLVGALTFLPALAMGPVVEHFLMGAGKLF